MFVCRPNGFAATKYRKVVAANLDFQRPMCTLHALWPSSKSNPFPPTHPEQHSPPCPPKAKIRPHNPPLLRSLHWLPVSMRIQHKMATLCYKCIHKSSGRKKGIFVAATKVLSMPPLGESRIVPATASDGRKKKRSKDEGGWGRGTGGGGGGRDEQDWHSFPLLPGPERVNQC